MSDINAMEQILTSGFEKEEDYGGMNICREWKTRLDTVYQMLREVSVQGRDGITAYRTVNLFIEHDKILSKKLKKICQISLI